MNGFCLLLAGFLTLSLMQVFLGGPTHSRRCALPSPAGKCRACPGAGSDRCGGGSAPPPCKATWPPMETTPRTDRTRMATPEHTTRVETSFSFLFGKEKQYGRKMISCEWSISWPSHSPSANMSAQEASAHGSPGDDGWAFRWSLPWKRLPSLKEMASCVPLALLFPHHQA